jgi:hypothetical protein
LLALLGTLLVAPLVEIELESFPPLTVEVPAGWVQNVEERVIGRGWLYVLFTANSAGDEALLLGAHAVRAGDGTTTSYGPQVFADQVSPGTVYVEVGLVGNSLGFIGSELQMYQLAPEEGPEARLASLPSSVTYEDQECTVYSVRFTKWARDWSAKVVCRNPVSADLVAQGLDILRSLSFPRAPITTQEQAIEAALAALPDDFRVHRAHLDICEKPGCDYTVISSLEEEGFTVRLEAVEPNASPRVTTCLVGFDGRVTLQ